MKLFLGSRLCKNKNKRDSLSCAPQQLPRFVRGRNMEKNKTKQKTQHTVQKVNTKQREVETCTTPFTVQYRRDCRHETHSLCDRQPTSHLPWRASQSQSMPSIRPSPFFALVFLTCHWRSVIVVRPRASDTAASSSAPVEDTKGFRMFFLKDLVPLSSKKSS